MIFLLYVCDFLVYLLWGLMELPHNLFFCFCMKHHVISFFYISFPKFLLLQVSHLSTHGVKSWKENTTPTTSTLQIQLLLQLSQSSSILKKQDSQNFNR